MGITHCEKHGKQGFSEVCGHIDAEYKQGIYCKHRDFCIGELLGILICEECWEKVDLNKLQPYLEMSEDEFLNLEDEEAKPIEDEWSEIYHSVGRRAWCVQCVAEVIVKQAQKNNEPLPFPIYEKTLTQLHQSKIDYLKKSLVTNFEFQKSVVVEIYRQEHPAVFFQAGSYKSPLTIKIYYVISEKEQDLIIEFINKFLSQTELNQAKIIFLEAENWIRTEHLSGIISSYKGEEKILKEVYLNC